jgi:hypothetical protein
MHRVYVEIWMNLHVIYGVDLGQSEQTGDGMNISANGAEHLFISELVWALLNCIYMR